ncbi:MAG: hypothetical protein AAB758_00415 [Patescibacteria group bacterium]
MYSIQIKNKAINLRKSGESIYEIARVLNLKPTTVSNWCKNILLTKNLRNKISRQGKFKARAAMLVYTENLREQRLRNTKTNMQEGAKMLGKLSSRDILMIGIGLYWGEGYKYENSELGFTNSNPDMISFYIKWLTLFNVDKSNLIFRITINEVFKSHEKIVKKFWINKLKVRKSQFSATTFIKTGLKKADVSNLKNYHGILRVKVKKGRRLRDKIMGALQHINSCS